MDHDRAAEIRDAALSLGMSRVYKDDHEMLGHGMVMYDAQCAWCREAQGEAHTWPPAGWVR